MSSSQEPGTGALGQMSSSEIAALENAFMEMLSSLEGESAAASTTTSKTRNAATSSTPKAPANEVKLGLRASDVAFPSGNNVYDHSPFAPFNLDEKVLKDFVPPQFMTVGLADGAKSLAAIDEFTRRSRIPTLRKDNTAPSHDDPDVQSMASCIMGFGAPGESYAVVFCDPLTRQFLRAHPLFQKPLCIEPHYSSIPIYIGSSNVHDNGENGKGKGLFAARRIAKDEVLFREPPLMIMTPETSPHIAMQFDKITSQTMPARTQAALDALHNCWPGNDRFGRVRTNMIAVDLPTRPLDRPFGGCFQLVSRANHSCAPNVSFGWDYRTFQGSLITDRVIEAGEEIFISYCDVHASKAARREEILRKYRFKCTCTRCGPD
ncbi:SET domain-containing protein [Exidia glandulosa HHB12029]|uniref:SET domain-containing protein n=1 Tax=Exidia glandulosa HHB12029 TaxID=1314781 RepID=A0A165CJT9_EXIGL|nr:SET domain-containing protein [Exidia glandulosa HHB12029]